MIVYYDGKKTEIFFVESLEIEWTSLQQDLQLRLVVGRPQVLHDPAHTTGLGHDLNGRGP